MSDSFRPYEDLYPVKQHDDTVSTATFSSTGEETVSLSSTEGGASQRSSLSGSTASDRRAPRRSISSSSSSRGRGRGSSSQSQHSQSQSVTPGSTRSRSRAPSATRKQEEGTHKGQRSKQPSHRGANPAGSKDVSRSPVPNPRNSKSTSTSPSTSPSTSTSTSNTTRSSISNKRNSSDWDSLTRKSSTLRQSITSKDDAIAATLKKQIEDLQQEKKKIAASHQKQVREYETKLQNLRKADKVLIDKLSKGRKNLQQELDIAQEKIEKIELERDLDAQEAANANSKLQEAEKRINELEAELEQAQQDQDATSAGSSNSHRLLTLEQELDEITDNGSVESHHEDRPWNHTGKDGNSEGNDNHIHSDMNHDMNHDNAEDSRSVPENVHLSFGTEGSELSGPVVVNPSVEEPSKPNEPTKGPLKDLVLACQRSVVELETVIVNLQDELLASNRVIALQKEQIRKFFRMNNVTETPQEPEDNDWKSRFQQAQARFSQLQNEQAWSEFRLRNRITNDSVKFQLRSEQWKEEVRTVVRKIEAAGLLKSFDVTFPDWTPSPEIRRKGRGFRGRRSPRSPRAPKDDKQRGWFKRNKKQN